MDTAKQIIDDLATRFALSDSEIARQANSTQPTIWRIRNGEVTWCTSDLYITLFQLRKSLNRKRSRKAA